MITNNWLLRKGDFFGGLTAGIVALPLALAFGIQSGLGAAAGLYGAIFLGFFAASFGGTPSQISGPTGPMTVVTTATVVDFVTTTGDLSKAIGPIIACFILAGIFQIIMGLAKIGSLVKFIPYPVISGFMSGIGCIIILLQIYPALGHKSPETTIDVIKGIGGVLSNANPWALFYATLTIAVIYVFPRITKAIPGTLVALICVTVLSLFIKTDVPIIGQIPEGWPDLQVNAILNISPELYSKIIISAITLASLGAIDSLLTSVIADNVTKTKHQSNQELIGQGLGNSVAGLFGGLPGAGATMRTLVNVRSGGRNRLSGVIHSLTLLIILLGAGKYAALIPKPVLAGILITVGIGILDYKGIRHIAKVPRADAVIMIIVLLATIFLDLLVAVGIGMVLASILFMKKMSDVTNERTHFKSIAYYTGELAWPEELMPDYMKDNVIVKHVDGPLFFGFASDFQKKLNKLPDIKYVIIRMEKVPFIDQTGLYAMEEAVLALEQNGVTVLLTSLQQQPHMMLKRIKIVPDLISEQNIFIHFEDSIRWLSTHKKPELV